MRRLTAGVCSQHRVFVWQGSSAHIPILPWHQFHMISVSLPVLWGVCLRQGCYCAISGEISFIRAGAEPFGMALKQVEKVGHGAFWELRSLVARSLSSFKKKSISLCTFKSNSILVDHFFKASCVLLFYTA